jgi:hypothetical protein
MTLILPTNIRLAWKTLAWTNTSLFLLDDSDEGRKSVITLTPDHIDKNVSDIFLF